MLGNKLISHIFYADDIFIFAPTLYHLQQLLDACAQYAISHDIIFNKTKSVAMLFGKTPSFGVCNPKLYNSKLEFVDKFKYLGHYFTSNLSDDYDIEQKIKYLYAHANMIRRRFYMCSDNIKILLFKSYLYNPYLCVLWSRYDKGTYNKFRVAYNNALRIIFNLPFRCSASTNFVGRGLHTFAERLRYISYKFYCRVYSCVSFNMYLSAYNACDLFWTSHLLGLLRSRFS